MLDEGLDQLLQVTVFIAVVWACGRLFRVVYAQLVGEIIAGIICSVHVMPWFQFTDGAVLLGEVGLILLVMEGGLSIQPSLLKATGPVAVAIAVSGTILPVLFGWGFQRALGSDRLEAIAAGAALSSTSIGMASKVLQDSGKINTRLGNLVTVAAIVDDILSLVILAVLQRLQASSAASPTGSPALTPSAAPSTLLPASGNQSSSAMMPSAIAATTTVSTTTVSSIEEGQNAWDILQPVVVSIAFIVASGVLVKLTPRVERQVPWRSWFPRPSGLVFLLLALCAGLVVATSVSGTTFLLGAFVAGMAFSQVDGTLEQWIAFAPLTEWLTSVFFASIGLRVPVAALFDARLFGLGVAYTLVAVLGKLVTGGFMRHLRRGLIVGWAMVGRGELGFLMASDARDSGLIQDDTFAIAAWALLLCTFMSPILMRVSLKQLGEQDPFVRQFGHSTSTPLPEPHTDSTSIGVSDAKHQAVHVLETSHSAITSTITVV
eukprot:m.364476 g.364476  ORF g.364476 m.364476 type:complete len:490 (-) comp27214_c0_seq1:7-1476(-)